MVAGVGFEPHDLRVMSPTSYQTAPPRDIYLPEPCNINTPINQSQELFSAFSAPDPAAVYERMTRILKVCLHFPALWNAV